MPYLSKKTLARYFRTLCARQLRLDLAPDNSRFRPERLAAGLPPPQPPRPGLAQIVEAGRAWEQAKLHDLTEAFGPEAVIGAASTDPSGRVRYRPLPLAEALARAAPHRFLVEAQFPVGHAFQRALGIDDYRARYGLEYAEIRPDLVQVLGPDGPAAPVRPAGASAARDAAPGQVLPGGDVLPLAPDDRRLRLRVIEIKLTAEPTPGYFAEVVFYSLALAGWLEDHGLDDHFVVVSSGAVWPGSHDAAQLVAALQAAAAAGRRPTVPELAAALELDLEPVPFEVFALRLRRFLREELPDVLARDWRELPWHVDTRCRGCEYLGRGWDRGDETAHPDHCLPQAARLGHLSRIAFLSRGASDALRSARVPDVAALSRRPADDPVFDCHPTLRASRAVVASRAAALAAGRALLPPRPGLGALLPRWADLHVYLTVDFDVGSGISFAFGLRAFWLEPPSPGAPPGAPRRQQAWERRFVVDQRSLAAEQRELLAFLDAIAEVLQAARAGHPDSTVQFYLWDTIQTRHLARVIGRHLAAVLRDRSIAHIAWLFPPEELLPNPALVTRAAPVTIVREAVRAAVAAPVPHVYTLLAVARSYHEADLPPSAARFAVHPLFEDELSDQIPSERAHEVWSRSTRPYWRDQLRRIEETVATRLRALATIVRRLEEDFDRALGRAAPRIAAIEPPPPPSRLSGVPNASSRRVGVPLSLDGQLWYGYARLDAALAELEVHQARVLPVDEREARFLSARLVRRLVGPAEEEALRQLGIGPAGSPTDPGVRWGAPAPQRRVYELAPGSCQVKVREGDFNLALAPASWPGFLDLPLGRLVQGTPLEAAAQGNEFVRLEEVTGVSVAALDRERRLIALDVNGRHAGWLDDLEAHGLADFSRDVVLDPVYRDFFTRKLLRALQALGNPPIARADPLVRRALGQPDDRAGRATPHVPAADVLWNAAALAGTPVARALGPVRAALEAAGVELNPTQWLAWERALSRRLALIWGPPGTGKSRTAAAIVAGAALEAALAGRPIRILVCTTTYTALDTVLLPAHDLLARLPVPNALVARLRSAYQRPDPSVPAELDVPVDRADESDRLGALVARLSAGEGGAVGPVVVGATPEQTYHLVQRAGGGIARAELFDLVLIDEASQMDVAHAVLPLNALASFGAVVLAGDPKQLPPIHQAEPPAGLEALVGSIYTFCETLHRVEPVMLDRNYRSNATLTAFAPYVGYGPTLRSQCPDLRLELAAPLPTTRPPDWPAGLYWTPEWSALLDPARPAVCFVYSDRLSSQWNRFEADAVAALVWLLARDGAPDPAGPAPSFRPLAPFFERVVGVVTPHRAQQGLIVGRLQQLFGPALCRGSGCARHDRCVSAATLRAAVDTVERFQGQQRDVIIASFAVGDPDTIADEDEFLLDRNRFNVMASRARAKLIVLVAREVVDHLAGELAVLHASRLLKVYAESFCNAARPMTLGVIADGVERPVPGSFRWRAAAD